VLAAAYLLIVKPLLDFYSQKAEILVERQELVRRLAVAAEQLPDLRAQLVELKSTANARKITIDGASDAIASANLQSRIGELAASTGVTIGSTEALTVENRGGYRRIGLRLALSAEYESIMRLLGAIQTVAPPLVISNLQLHGVLRANGEPSTRLEVAFEVYGFRSTDTSVGLKQ